MTVRDPIEEDGLEIYNNVTDEEIWVLVERDVITIAEWLKFRQTGKIEKGNIRIYKK